MIKAAAFIFALFLFAAPVSAYERGTSSVVNGKEIKTANKFLSLTFLPERSGRISSIILKNSNLELLTPTIVSKITETPLFSFVNDNMNGIYELIWGKKINGAIGVEYLQKDNKICFKGNFYGALEFNIDREVTLIPDALAIEIKAVFTNTAKTAQTLAPWVHLVGTPVSAPQIPCAPGYQRRSGFGKVGFSDIPELFTFKKDNNFLLPGDNWMAVKQIGKNVVWVLRVPAGTLDKEGVYYSWGDGKVNGVQSTEIIWPSKTIAPGQTMDISYCLEIFPGLDSINAMWGNSGVSLTVKAGKVVMKFAASRQEPARKAAFEWKNPGKDAGVFRFDIPALAPGESAEITLPLTELPRTAILRDRESGKTATVFF